MSLRHRSLQIDSTLSPTVASFKVLSTSPSKSLAPTGSKTHKVLLSRSQDILLSYLSTHDSNPDSTSYNLPSLAASKVLTVLAEADAQLDARTLAVVMRSYLRCGDGEGALNAFRACTGLTSNATLPGSNEVNEGGESFVWYGKDRETHRIADNVYGFDLNTGTEVMRAHAMGGGFKEAVKVLREMLKWKENGGIKVDGYAWNVCLSACRSEVDYKGAKKLFEAMPEEAKGRATYNTMLRVVCDYGDMEEARGMMEGMKRGGRKERLLDGVGVTTVMKGWIDRGELEEAMSLFSEANFYGIKNDVTAYNTVLRGLLKTRDFERAEALMERMEGEGVKPDYMTYSYLMKGMVDFKKYADAMKVFDDALATDIKVVRNVGIYTTAITAAARSRQLDKAMGYVGKMKLEGLKPNVKVLTSLVNACVMCGKPEVGIEVWESIKTGVTGEVDSRAKLTAVRAMVMMRRWDDAMEVLGGGKSGGKGFKGNEIMEGYEGVILGMAGEGEWGRAEGAVREMLKYGFVPSGKCMIGIMRGCNIHRDKGGGNEEVRGRREGN